MKAGRRFALLASTVLASFVAPTYAQSTVNADAALVALDNRNCEGVMDALNQGMANNEPRSFYVAGQLFESGVCLRADPGKAASTYERAALQGDNDAARALVLLHARGSGVPQSYAQAGVWYGVLRQEKRPPESYGTPDAIARTYVEAVHDLAQQRMVYPREALLANVRGAVRVRFDPETGVATVVSSADNTGQSMTRVGPNRHAFERALLAGYDEAVKALPKPALPAGASYASEREVKFDRTPNTPAGPQGRDQLRR